VVVFGGFAVDISTVVTLATVVIASVVTGTVVVAVHPLPRVSHSPLGENAELNPGTSTAVHISGTPLQSYASAQLDEHVVLPVETPSQVPFTIPVKEAVSVEKTRPSSLLALNPNTRIQQPPPLASARQTRPWFGVDAAPQHVAGQGPPVTQPPQSLYIDWISVHSAGEHCARVSADAGRRVREVAKAMKRGRECCLTTMVTTMLARKQNIGGGRAASKGWTRRAEALHLTRGW
jgi:hypothetical protein